MKILETIMDDASRPAPVRIRCIELLAAYAAGLPTRVLAGDEEVPLIPNPADVERDRQWLIAKLTRAAEAARAEDEAKAAPPVPALPEARSPQGEAAAAPGTIPAAPASAPPPAPAPPPPRPAPPESRNAQGQTWAQYFQALTGRAPRPPGPTVGPLPSRYVRSSP